MKLNDYLEKNDLSVSQFAKIHNLNQPTVWRVVKCKFHPSARTALAIEQATNGVVTIRDLMCEKQ